MVKRNRAGFTLAEAMITVAILGIITSVSANLLIQTNRYFLLTRARNDLQRDSRTAMYVMTRELRQAQSNSIVIDRISGQPFFSRITFTKQQGTTVTFEQSGNTLSQITSNKAPITLTKNLCYLSFSFPRSDDMTIVSVSMTLQELIYQGRWKALHMASEKVQVMD